MKIREFSNWTRFLNKEWSTPFTNYKTCLTKSTTCQLDSKMVTFHVLSWETRGFKNKLCIQNCHVSQISHRKIPRGFKCFHSRPWRQGQTVCSRGSPSVQQKLLIFTIKWPERKYTILMDDDDTEGEKTHWYIIEILLWEWRFWAILFKGLRCIHRVSFDRWVWFV